MTHDGSKDAGSCPYVLGLTGSIGMGKSTVCATLKAQSVPVLEADDVVHQLYAPGGAAVAPVSAAFPGVLDEEGGGIDRAKLAARVLGDGGGMAALEALVHPLVEAARVEFLQREAAAGQPLVVFDIPLLFETRAEAAVDAVAVVSAPPEVQRSRVLARPGMTEAKFEAILARQVPDAEKRQRADIVIDTGCSLADTEAQVLQFLEQLRIRRGGAASRTLARRTQS